MNISYEGIGQWAATFACDHLAEGELVKISANGTVSTCSDGESFCGMVLSTARDGLACSVALGGMITAGYSGESAPALGWSTLAADGAGGVKTAAEGHSFLVVDVDESGKTVTFAL